MNVFRKCLFAIVLFAVSAFAQDARENLGPKDNANTNAQPLADHPIVKLMASAKWQLRPELRDVHPRVYFTAAEIEGLRQRAHGSHHEQWQKVLDNLYALHNVPPTPEASEERRAQNTVAIAIAEAAFAYSIEHDPKYLEAAKKFMDAAVSYEVWGYRYNKPNVDLAAGHLLYGLGWAYDLLYNDLTPDERDRYRSTLVKHGQLLYDYFKPKAGRSYSYSQNHLFIPIAGLAVAAYALQGEAPEAENWARLSRALYDRVLETYSPDGYYYEGFEYWIFSTPWLVHFLDAQAHATGEDLYDRAPGLKLAHLYVAHAQLPGGQNVFDFGDVFSGPLGRTGKDEDTKRTHPGGHFQTNYNLLYRLAQRFKSSDAQGVAEWQKGMGQGSAEDFWSLAWYEPSLAATPITKLTVWHYFADHDVVYWRSDWSATATAVAFKCGPPEGHHTNSLSQRLPDWHLEAGHAHPDANSFIIFAGGQYLTGDSGYAGVPTTDQHNTLLVDGHGQAAEGAGHSAWDGFPYSRLDQLHISVFKTTSRGFSVTGEAAPGYDPALGLTRFQRTLELANGVFTIHDHIASSSPHTFTELIHADEAIADNGRDLEIDARGTRLQIHITQPQNSIVKIEANSMRAAGRPGSVANGPEESRGVRARVSTPTPVNTAIFDFEMRVAGRQTAGATKP